MPRKTGNGPGTGPGHGGEAKGPGWGGPARGLGSGAPTAIRQTGNFGQNVPGARAANVANRQELQEFYTEMMRDAEQHGMTRIAAADRLYDRLEGKSVQRSVNVNLDDPSALSDHELDAEIARRLGTAAAAFAGADPSKLPN